MDVVILISRLDTADIPSKLGEINQLTSYILGVAPSQ